MPLLLGIAMVVRERRRVTRQVMLTLLVVTVQETGACIMGYCIMEM
jgi:hypothetical protein